MRPKSPTDLLQPQTRGEIRIQFSKYNDPEVAGLAITYFGHIVRIHRELDVDRVMRILNELRNNPELAGSVSDALDDINLYLEIKDSGNK